MRSLELGLWPLRSKGARRRGRNRERGTQGTRLERWCGHWETAERKLGNGGARGSREGESERGRCGECPLGHRPFIGARGRQASGDSMADVQCPALKTPVTQSEDGGWEI
jgi:hypothetical protein